MAKLTITAALAVVFLFLAVSPAHLQEVDQKEHKDRDLEKQVILLPSENVEYKSAISEIAAEKQDDTVTEKTISKAESQESTSVEPAVSVEEADPEGHTVRLTMISFHPINRGFPRRPFLSFRHGHRFNCHHRRQFRPWDPRFQKKENSYGNDMLVGDDKPNFDPEMRPHHHERPSFIFRDEAGPHHHHGEDGVYEHGPHHHRHGPHGEEEEHEHGPHHHHHEHHHHMEEMDEERRGGFMKIFRKFLNHF